MLQSVNLRDYMLTNPIKVKADANLHDATRVIIDKKISGVCVVDNYGVLVGIPSEMDCLDAIIKASYNGMGVGLVQEYMITDNHIKRIFIKRYIMNIHFDISPWRY